ncbi:glycosyltransferase family 2 protein [Massilia glaciei]|nr:glycosyltransferase [Massilia glaciei]
MSTAMPDATPCLKPDATPDVTSDAAPCAPTATGAAGTGAAAPPPAGQALLPLISVVVSASGRAHLLERNIAALVHQSLARGLYEIIIVDAFPNQHARHVVAAWRARTHASGPAIAYLHGSGTQGRAAAHNLGWRSGRGTIIGFTDDDTVPSPDWLLNALDAFDDHIDALYGRIDHAGVHCAARATTLEFAAANCFCRKSVLAAVGGFDERFRLAWRDDTDLQFRLAAINARLTHAPHASVTQPPRPASWGARLMQADKIAFDALLYKKHPLMYRQKIRGAPRWDYYATAAALLLALLGLAAGNRALALAGAAAWASALAVLCRRRLRGRSGSAALLAEAVVTAALLPPLAVFWRAAGAIRFRVWLA